MQTQNTQSMQNQKRSGIVRGFRFELDLLLRSFWQYLIVVAGIGVIWYFLEIMSLTSMMMMFAFMIPMLMSMQRYTGYFSQTVGLGISRRSFILSGLLMKPVYMLSVLITSSILLIFQFVINGKTEQLAPLLLSSLYIPVLCSILFSFAGELMGLLILRFNRFGYIIYMVLYILTFMLFGAVVGMFEARGISIYDITGGTATIVSIVVLAVSLLIFIVNSLLIRKVEVK